MHIKEFLDVELPVIQAPMAGVQDSALAVAVSLAGGLGSLPCAMLGAEEIDRELAAITSQTDRPVNLNFFCHGRPVENADREAVWRNSLQPYFDEYGVTDIPGGPGREPFNHQLADVIEPYKPSVVSFHFGLPDRELLDRVKSWGATVLASATTVAEAQWLEQRGADGVIAQGLEAGGHRGVFLSDDLTTQVGTFSLLPQILKHVNVPVIAAGGIADAAGVRASMSLGAIGVQVGTTYLLCDESKASEIHRDVLKSDGVMHTAITNLFSGRPARSVVNRAVRELGPMSSNTPAFPLASVAITALRKKAESKGVGDFSPLWCGQNASGCKEISAAELTRQLAEIE